MTKDEPVELSDANKPPASELLEAIDMEHSSLIEASRALQRMLHYSASVSERTIRSASAIAGGLVRESTNWLVPVAFRNSKSYSIFVQQILDYVSTDLSSVKRAWTVGKDEQQVDLARKTVGNLLDVTALATFHLSPLTVMAIFSDIAYGSQIYLEILVWRLKEQGIVELSAPIANTAQLLDALETASGNAVGMFDQPPISLEGLRQTIEQTRQIVDQVDPAQLLPFAEIDQMWRQMELAAHQQRASVWDVSATMSVAALNSFRAQRADPVVSLHLAANLFHERLIDHYWSGLRAIEKQGLVSTLSKDSKPYLEAVWINFSIDRKTWSEQLLSGELLKWGWSQLSWPKLPRLPANH